MGGNVNFIKNHLSQETASVARSENHKKLLRIDRCQGWIKTYARRHQFQSSAFRGCFDVFIFRDIAANMPKQAITVQVHRIMSSQNFLLNFTVGWWKMMIRTFRLSNKHTSGRLIKNSRGGMFLLIFGLKKRGEAETATNLNLFSFPIAFNMFVMIWRTPLRGGLWIFHEQPHNGCNLAPARRMRRHKSFDIREFLIFFQFSLLIYSLKSTLSPVIEWLCSVFKSMKNVQSQANIDNVSHPLQHEVEWGGERSVNNAAIISRISCSSRRVWLRHHFPLSCKIFICDNSWVEFSFSVFFLCFVTTLEHVRRAYKNFFHSSRSHKTATRIHPANET